MIPTAPTLNAIVSLLAQDPATFAPVTDALKIHLAKAPFTPGPQLVPGDFTEATFTGSAALSAGVGACQQFYDADGLRVVQLKEPAGGWFWNCTADPATPETIYGYYLTDNAGAVCYGCQLLPNPVQTISAAGQAINIGYIRFTFLNSSPF